MPSRAAEHPAYLYLGRRIHGEAVVSEATELVIDGFTRSASTFAVVAFQLAQPRPVRVGHHMHAAGQIIHAVRLGIPTLLTVRPPEDTVLSLVTREPYVTLGQGLAAYARFHEKLLARRDGMVAADFPEVTEHCDRTIGRLASAPISPVRPHARADARVLRADRDALAAAAVAARDPRLPVRARHRRRCAPGRGGHSGAVAAVPEDRAQRPSAYKEARKGELRGAYNAAGLARLRRRADALYAQFAAAGPT